MKVLKKIIIWILVIIAILIVIAYFLPKQYSVERSIVINADREQIYFQLCDFDNWENWTPWGEALDTTAVYKSTGGCDSGAVQQWSGDITGNGKMVMTRVIPNERIEYDLSFEGGKYESHGTMTIEPEGPDYKVTWTDKGDLGYNPVARYMGLMMENMLGPDFEQGLQNLKEYTESLPEFPEIEVVTVDPVPAISITDTVAVNEIGNKMGEYYSMLIGYARDKRTAIVGYPYAIYYTWNGNTTLMEAGIPVEKELPDRYMIKGTMAPAGKVVKATHIGAYEDKTMTHEAISQYIAMNNLEVAGSPWEIYITDPSTEPDSTNWETLIMYPIK
ncbi:MAG: SRPBCC family protein [Bacteroidales bacterium]